MGAATIELPPPASVNHTNRGRNPKRRHAVKRQLQGEIATLLLAAGVPRPIPGDRVRASAHILFPTRRHRDEDNYRSGLSKALGDALAPAPTKEERELGLAPMFVWLSNDTPAHFTFGAVTFGLTEYVTVPVAHPRSSSAGRRRPPVAIVTLTWGDDLADLVEREARELRAALDA